MYAGYFQLEQSPFGLTPDTRFYVPLPQHQAALQVLNTALQNGEGFIKVTGEVGTGKTLLCRLLLNQAPEHWQLAYIPDPSLNAGELRWTLAAELGLKFSANIDSIQLLQLLQRQLILLAGAGKQVVLVIDEAQVMTDDTLEALRLLTNLETEQRKLLQVVLFGQPELDQRLAQINLRQLRQRITFSYTLTVMNTQQTAHYLQQRLQLAGAERQLFSNAALQYLCRSSRGIPRLVNILAHKGLMLAYGEGAEQVSASHIRYAANDTDDATRAFSFFAHYWLGCVLLGLIFAASSFVWYSQ